MNPAKAKIISFLNFKGGVGKTSCVVNIGACLADKHLKKVLIVDLDAQCNSTFWLLRPSDYEYFTGQRGGAVSKLRWSVYQIFQDALRGTQLFHFDASCIQGIPLNSSRFPEIPQLHLLPAVIELLEIEQQVAPSQQPAFVRSLADALRQISDRYDYILLDCPPHLFRITQAALLASQYTVIPYNPDFLSLSGLKMLCKLLGEMDAKMQGFRPGFAKNQIAAMILNRFDKKGKIWGQARTELELQMQFLKNAGLLHPACCLLEPSIRSSVHIAEASSEHKPVIIHAPNSIGAEDYCLLTANFIKHFEETL